MARAVVVGGGQLWRSIPDRARGVQALRALRAEGKGVKEDPPRRTARQSLKQLEVGAVTTAAAQRPVLAGLRGGHQHGRGQSGGRGREQAFSWGFTAGRRVRDWGGGTVAVQAARRCVCM